MTVDQRLSSEVYVCTFLSPSVTSKKNVADSERGTSEPSLSRIVDFQRASKPAQRSLLIVSFSNCLKRSYVSGTRVCSPFSICMSSPCFARSSTISLIVVGVGFTCHFMWLRCTVARFQSSLNAKKILASCSVVGSIDLILFTIL